PHPEDLANRVFARRAARIGPVDVAGFIDCEVVQAVELLPLELLDQDADFAVRGQVEERRNLVIADEDVAVGTEVGAGRANVQVLAYLAVACDSQQPFAAKENLAVAPGWALGVLRPGSIESCLDHGQPGSEVRSVVRL